MSTINRVIYFILLITLGVFIYLLINLGLVPDKYIWVLLAVCISIISIIGTINFTFKNNILHTIMLLFTLLLIGGFTYINYNLFKTNSFINVIDNELKEEVSYYLLTKKDNSYKNVLELENTTVGVYSFNSNNFKDAYENLKEKFTFNEKEYNDVSFLIKDLKNSKISAIFISANNYEILKEEIEEYNDTKILHEVKVALVKDVGVMLEEEKSLLVEPFNIYISGIDTSGSINYVSRSDVNIVMSVNPNTNEIILTSIPRDYYVKLYNTTGYKDKLTHAGIYGIEKSLKTVEDLLDINIDYYVRVNFTTIVEVIDTIGGIDVYSDQNFSEYGYSYKKGMNHLNGQEALMFARIRHVFADGDRKRGEHQQAVIEAVIEKISNSKTLLLNYANLLDSLRNTFQTNIASGSIKELAKYQLDKMPTWKVKSVSLNGKGSYDYTYSIPGRKLYVMIPDEKTIENAKKYINGLFEGLTLEEIEKLAIKNTENIKNED